MFDGKGKRTGPEVDFVFPFFGMNEQLPVIMECRNGTLSNTMPEVRFMMSLRRFYKAKAE